jgi:hypothetical protein
MISGKGCKYYLNERLLEELNEIGGVNVSGRGWSFE